MSAAFSTKNIISTPPTEIPISSMPGWKNPVLESSTLRIGVDAVNRIIEKSEEIAELKSKITITTDIQEIDELAVKIKSLKLNIEDISSTGLIIGFDVGTKEIEAINNEINELIKSRQTLIDDNKIEFEGVDQARRQIEELKKRVKNNTSLKEIILAFSLSPQGDHTDLYVREELKEIIEKLSIKISSLGRGLSTGTELEYSDNATLGNALKNRQ